VEYSSRNREEATMSRKRKLKDTSEVQLSLTFDAVAAPVYAAEPTQSKKDNVINFTSYSRSGPNSSNSESVMERLLREAKQLTW
ncbi:MAG: hypothetical protein ACTS5I_11895, partial [Rhodanobacter sp.]